MTRRAPRVVLVASAASELAQPLVVPAFLALARHGWDAHLVFDGAEPALWPTLGELSDRGLRPRIHLSPVHKPRGWERTALTRALIRGLLANPLGAARYLGAGGATRPRMLAGRDVEGVLIALRPDLVHFDSPASAAGRLRVGRVIGCRMVVSFPGEDDEGALSAPRRARVWERADVLHFPHESAREHELARGLPPGRPYVVFPLPATHARPRDPEPGRQERGDTPGRPLRILSVGPLSWQRGYEWAIQAVRELEDRGVPCAYRILGGGEFIEALAYARYQLGLEDRVEFIEPAGREELRRQLEWADVLVDATVVAGVPGSVAEAQAMALPVVASDRTQAPEGALDEETGFRVPRRDPAALADCLALLAADPERRERIGEAARRRHFGHWSLEGHLAALEGLYERVGRGAMP